ncbi:MAG: shikimate dehydrogenase (NADP(+)) [Bacteroidia bacterium]|nr:MAG: shikimate dehydrogenase (NADP(+)) [Bacteroidia bacterium]
MQRYAIIGHPVSHSVSPKLHNAAFAAVGLDCHYEAIDIDPADLGDGIASLRSSGIAGFNVTIPHKKGILPLLDRIDDAARAVGAVNTVVHRDGVLTGYNTDIHGFRALIAPFEKAVNGGTVGILGAGGASRAVLHVLTTSFTPRRIVVLNRTTERAEEIAGEFSSSPVPIVPESLFQDELQELVSGLGVIINTTSVGMKPYTDASPLEQIDFRRDQIVADLIYTPAETALLKAAKEAGATAVGGLEMFLQQAAESFRLWTGKEVNMRKLWEGLE